MATSKKCSKCKQIKAISEFYKDRGSKDGLHYWCKQCNKQEHTQYAQQHRKEFSLNAKSYYNTLKGNIRHIWKHMLYRCNNPKCAAYKYYGGRGIKVNFASFDDFFNYIVKLKTDTRKLTIDRIDNEKDYEPGNIRFVSQAENNKNRRKTFK